MELRPERDGAFDNQAVDFTSVDRRSPLADLVQPVRLEKVRSIRRALHGGGYDTDETLDAAIARLSEELLPGIWMPYRA